MISHFTFDQLPVVIHHIATYVIVTTLHNFSSKWKSKRLIEDFLTLTFEASS